MYGSGVRIGPATTVAITKPTPRGPFSALSVLVVAAAGSMTHRTVVHLIAAAVSPNSTSAISVSDSLAVQIDVELRVKNYELRVLSLLFIVN